MKRAVLLLFAVAAAGCGGSADRISQPPPRERPGNCAIHTSKQRTQFRQLQADVAAMRHAAAPVKKRTLMGTPATRRTTDVFIRHADASSLPVFVKSRMFDHAAAAVSPACEQCFQWLEADRPVAGGAKLAQSCRMRP